MALEQKDRKVLLLLSQPLGNLIRLVRLLRIPLVVLVYVGIPILTTYLISPPKPFQTDASVWLSGGITSAVLGVLAWGIVNLAEPVRYYRNWTMVKMIGLPMVWLLLVLLWGMFFQYFLNQELQFFRDVEFCVAGIPGVQFMG